MDRDRFDALARALTTQRPRREALKVLGAAGIATAAGGAVLESALARKKRKKKKDKDKGKRCRGDRTKCRGACLEPGLVCCSATTAGINGSCPASHPNCCPGSVFGGCCPPDRPVCCAEDCCLEGEECDEDGFCTTPD